MEFREFGSKVWGVKVVVGASGVRGQRVGGALRV